MSGQHLGKLLALAVTAASKAAARCGQDTPQEDRERLATIARRTYLDAMKAAGMPEHLAEKEFQAAYTKRTGQQFLFNNQ